MKEIIETDENGDELVVLQNLQSIRPMVTKELSPNLLMHLIENPMMAYEVMTDDDIKVFMLCPIEDDESMLEVSIQMNDLLEGNFTEDYFAVGKWLEHNPDLTPEGYKPFVGGFDSYERINADDSPDTPEGECVSK